MYEIRNCAGQYSGKLHWKFLQWRTGIWRDAVKLSPILHSYFCSCTTLFFLKWQTLKGDGETAEMVVHFPLGHSSVGRVLAVALWLCRVRKQAQRAQLFAVSILKATTQAKSPLNDSPSLITWWMYSFQDLQSQPHRLSTWRTNSSKSPPISGFPHPASSKPPDFLHPHQKMHFLHFFTLARHKGQHQNFLCLLRTFIPVPQKGD